MRDKQQVISKQKRSYKIKFEQRWKAGTHLGGDLNKNNLNEDNYK